MSYQSNASEQPKVYNLRLTITDSTLDEALISAAFTAANDDGHPELNTVQKLKAAGLFYKYLHAAVVTALDSHLVDGS
jgi:hypothetical protein